MDPPLFFTKKQSQPKPRVITDEKKAECTALLAQGHCPAEAARLAGIGESTLRKAIARGQIIHPVTPVVPDISQSPGSAKACQCANGLFSGIGRHLKLPAGFYSCLHILLILGFMALARISRPEGRRHVPPGELGRCIGLDRDPEVRTLREKVALMASTGNPDAWMKELAREWMEDDPDETGYLDIDGHVRVYHGEKAKFRPRNWTLNLEKTHQ